MQRQILKEKRAVIETPSDPLLLLRVAARLGLAGVSGVSGRVMHWMSVAVCTAGADGADVVRSSEDWIARLLARPQPGKNRRSAVDRICGLAPMQVVYWKLAALVDAEQEDAASRTRNLMRGILVDPGAPDVLLELASHWSEATEDRSDAAVLLIARSILLDPGRAASYFALAVLLRRSLTIDASPPPRLAASLRRWIILGGDLAENSGAVLSSLRFVGDCRRIISTGRWTEVMARASGLRSVAREHSDIHSFEADVRAMAPFAVEIDFPARTFGRRVLLHPKLPDSGCWVVSGPHDQRRRAVRVLRFANPDAVISEDDPLAPADRPAGARTLSLVPTSDVDAWLLSCLYGHWHVWWTVLPAILDPNGRPDLDQVLAYGVRTRQFVTFWYAKGHERRYIDENRTLGRSIADRMSDAASRDRYVSTMDADRASYLRAFFTRIAYKLQYFDYAVYRPGDVVLNLGVSEGFEVPAFLSLISPGGVLHNIDPEGDSTLGAPARAWVDGTETCAVHFHRVALSDVDGTIEMETGGCWEDTRVSKRKLGRVIALPSMRLDTFIAQHGLDRIDHIKLDIEGGEGFLLDQLIAVMRTHRPQIAISIYHMIEQFFEIPDRMMRESDGYRFFFEHYCGHFGEGTLYAIPEEIEPTRPIVPYRP
jgi:FkbM family methyltransferase